MDEKELLMLSKTFSKSWKLLPIPYLTADMYGFGRYIAKYGYYPRWLPLCINTEHGPGQVNQFITELKTDAPVQLFHSPDSVKKWKLVSKKWCFSFMSPFVFYRKISKLERSNSAKGTIAFLGHTTICLEDFADPQIYIDQLKQLPAKFHPVDVCLHMTDINKGIHKLFIANGINVLTAGNILDDNFIERFYSIIRNYKYSTSNYLGSYCYYCIEMGIPFFIYGQAPKYISSGDPTAPEGEFDPYKLYDTHREAHNLFSTMTTTITEEQKVYVKRGLGIYDGISRIKMAGILYYSLIRRIFMWRSILDIYEVIRRSISGTMRPFDSFRNSSYSGKE